MENSGSNKRKVLLINKRFQLSMLSWFFLLAIGLIALFYTANWYFFQNLTKLAQEAGLPSDHVFFQFIEGQKIIMNRIYIITSSLSIVVITVGGLVLSHKIAGPLYRLTRHLEKNSMENVTPVKFRTGDYFQEIQHAFNEFIKKK